MHAYFHLCASMYYVCLSTAAPAPAMSTMELEPTHISLAPEQDLPDMLLDTGVCVCVCVGVCVCVCGGGGVGGVGGGGGGPPRCTHTCVHIATPSSTVVFVSHPNSLISSKVGMILAPVIHCTIQQP